MSGTPAGKEKRKGGRKKHGKGLEREKVKNQEIIMKETGQEVQLEGRGQGHTLDQGLGHIQGHLLGREHLDVQNLARPDVQDHLVAHYLGHQEDLQGGKDQLHPLKYENSEPPIELKIKLCAPVLIGSSSGGIMANSGMGGGGRLNTIGGMGTGTSRG
jgi:hypothetical protein